MKEGTLGSRTEQLKGTFWERNSCSILGPWDWFGAGDGVLHQKCAAFDFLRKYRFELECVFKLGPEIEVTTHLNAAHLASLRRQPDFLQLSECVQ